MSPNSQLLSCATWDDRGTLRPERPLTAWSRWRGRRASGWCWRWFLCLRWNTELGHEYVNCWRWKRCLCRGDSFLTVGFPLLPRVAVVEDALGVVGPGQAAELHPLQLVGQLGQVVTLHEAHGHPVRAAAAQAVGEILALLRQTSHWTEKQLSAQFSHPPHLWTCRAVWLTLQGHGAILGQRVRVEEHGGRSVQRVLHVQHVLVLEAFVVEVEEPGTRFYLGTDNIRAASQPRHYTAEVTVQLVPLPSLVRAAVFGIVVELGEALMELGADSALLQVRHGQLVLLLNKRLRHKNEREGLKASQHTPCVHQSGSKTSLKTKKNLGWNEN